MAGNEEMSAEDIAALLSGGLAPKGPPYNPQKQAALMTASAELYLNPTRLEPKQIVRQRIGLCVNRREFQPTAFVFVKYLMEPIVVNLPTYHHLNCVLGQADHEGDLQFILADAARFEVYPEEDLERLGAEASKAIN